MATLARLPLLQLISAQQLQWFRTIGVDTTADLQVGPSDVDYFEYSLTLMTKAIRAQIHEFWC